MFDLYFADSFIRKIQCEAEDATKKVPRKVDEGVGVDSILFPITTPLPPRLQRIRFPPNCTENTRTNEVDETEESA